MEQHTIVVRGLRRTYGSGARAFEAVRGVDLEVEPGSIHALLGVNGAGKTSTLEVIEGLASPSAGEVRVLGLDPVTQRAAVRRQTGTLLQTSAFVGDLSVRETVQMWAATVTSPRPVDEALEMLDLAGRAEVRMKALSGGERRRVDLACTLLGHPRVVVLDEPTTGLDPESRLQVWQLIRDLRDDGVAVLMSTHYLDEAEALADRLSLMRAGRVVREGTLAEIVAEQPSEISFGTNAGPGRWPAGVLEDVERAEEGGRTVLHTRRLQEDLLELLRWADSQHVVLERLVARTASLESVFLAVARDDADTPVPEDPLHRPTPRPSDLEGSLR